MVAEIRYTHDSTSDPAAFLARYMDNNYITVHNAPPHILPAVRSFLKLFYSHLYGIPMKWEPDRDSITWCEGSLSNQGSLVLKGVPHQPLLPDSICSMWDRWQMVAKPPPGPPVYDPGGGS